jgi:small nuclear ribonucleoprotein (snRNP)-like protein
LAALNTYKYNQQTVYLLNMNKNEAEKILHQKFIGRTLKVQTKNNRIFQGKLMGVDFKGNIILH